MSTIADQPTCRSLYSWSKSASKTYTVTACNEDEAEEAAYAAFEDETDLESDDVDDWEIESVDEVWA